MFLQIIGVDPDNGSQLWAPSQVNCLSTECKNAFRALREDHSVVDMVDLFRASVHSMALTCNIRPARVVTDDPLIVRARFLVG